MQVVFANFANVTLAKRPARGFGSKNCNLDWINQAWLILTRSDEPICV